MRVEDRAHRVDLEVLVRAHRARRLDRAPVREARLRVVEPLVAQVLHVVAVQVAYALRDLRARHSPVQIKHLRAELLHDVGGGLQLE